jgi:hypothetical protein
MGQGIRPCLLRDYLATERKVGRLTMELDMLKNHTNQSPGGGEPSSIVTGPLPVPFDRVQDDRSPEKQLLSPIDGKDFKTQRYRARCDY